MEMVSIQETFRYSFGAKIKYTDDYLSQHSQDYNFHSLQHFATKLHTFTQLRMLFPAVLINFLYSKVYLIGNWSIVYTWFLHSCKFGLNCEIFVCKYPYRRKSTFFHRVLSRGKLGNIVAVTLFPS